MNVIEFLSSLAKKDIRLWLEGENLRFSAPEGVFSGELRNEVVKRKPEIIAFLKQAQKLSDAPIARAERDKELVLSFGQRRLWILAQLTPNDVTYNMASALALRGPVRIDLLQKTFSAIVQRHESLRTRFVEQDGATSQIIDDGSDWALTVHDLSSIEVMAQEVAVQQALDQEVLTPYSLASGPLFRVQVIKRSDDEHVLVVGMHHIVSDGWSMEILVKELVTLYVSFAAGLPDPMPPLSVQYADFAAWQHQWMNSDGLKKQLDYWHETLAGAPPVLALPTDRPRQANPRNHGAVLQRSIDRGLGSEINHFCQRHELTPFMLFLGAWQLLLGRYAHSEDVIVGSPIAGRSRAEFEEIIGFFVNLLLMRADLSGNPSVAEYFSRIRKQALGAFSHQDVPIDHLLETLQVERQPGYPPVAQVGFQLINVGDSNAALQGPIRVEPIPLKHVAARMDMLLAVGKNEDQYSLSIEYNIDLFNASTIALVAEQFECLLSQVVKADNTGIQSLNLMSREALRGHLALPAKIDALIPLNGNQRSMLLDELTHAGTHQNNYGIYCELPFVPDLDRLVKALEVVTAAHAALRTRIVPCTLPGLDDYWLAVSSNHSVALHQHDIRHQSEDWRVFVEKLLHRAQSVVNVPLVHFHLVQRSDNDHILVVGCHHIVLDGASTYLLMKDILDVYAGVRLPVSDLSVWVEYNEQDRLASDTSDVIDFWKLALNGVEPLDFTKPVSVFKAQPVSVFNDRRQEHRVEGEWLANIRNWCKQQQITPALFFKAVYALLLKEYCRAEEDFAFFEFHANRNASQASSIGCYYQQSPVVIRKSAWQMAGDIKEVFNQLIQLRNAAKGKRRFSLAEQNHWVPRARAVFMYNYYNFVVEAQADGIALRPQMSAPKVDKGVQFIVRDEGPSLTFELRYDVDVFDDMDFLARVVSVATQISDGVESLAKLSLLLEDESAWLNGQNCTDQALPAHASIVTWFEEQARTTPDRVAVVYGTSRMTYAKLNGRANQLARYLGSQGVGAGSRIALCFDRGPELVVAVWAALKSGASYVPVDPAYPLDRIDHILKDSNASRLLTLVSLKERLPHSTCSLVLLDGMSFDAFDSADLDIKPSADQEIYVIYTSGSTGLPKGAAVTHRGEVNLQNWYLQSLQTTAEDRPVLISAVGFDLTQKNLFAPLLKGGAIVIPSMDFYDDEAILNAIKEHQATWINCAPSAFYPLVEADRSHHFSRLMSLRFVVLGGEPIRLSALFDWLASPVCKARIMNSYGPTECTDVVASHVLDDVDQATVLIPIGKPIPNMQLHVVNEPLQPLPPGLVGEIAVTGIAVGLGYLNRESLNASVFVPNPFGDGRLYKTGDLGRYLPDGSIEYLGRKDFQVKLRGLRIELGEIEVALKELPTVSDSLVLVRSDQLVGYVLSDGGVVPDGWRDSLRTRLPDYMVPSALVPLEAWPLTPNGKIDRKALPEPHEATGGAVDKVAPRTPIEHEIAAIWSEFLGRDGIGVLDNLFELGGNSITATRIASRLRKFYSIDISVRDVFRAANIAELAIAIERAQLNENVPPLLPVSRDQSLPLSFAQQRLWMLDQFDPGLPAYNMPGAFRMLGGLNIDALERALQYIVSRHEILRSHVLMENDTPRMAFDEVGQWKLVRLDLSSWAKEDRDAEVQRRITNELSFRFDLYRGPLLRVTLITSGDDEHVMISNMHHMVGDGWSNGVFIHELSQGYDAFRTGMTPALAPLLIQYADFAAWQRAWLTDAELEKQLAHWRKALAGLAPLRLPVDFQRKRDANNAGASLAFAIPPKDYQLLLRLCQREGVTLYMVLMAAYMVLLARYSNQRDISVGTPIANRNNEAVEGLIGFFVNTLVIRGQIRSGASFAEFVQAIRAQTLGAYAHQDVPFERVVDALAEQRNLYRTPLFQTMFALQNVPMEQHIALPDVQVEPLGVQAAQAKFELSLSMLEWQGELRGELEYRADLFLQATAQQWVEEFIALVARLVAQPDAPLHALLSVETATTGWSFVPEAVLWEQDSLIDLQGARQAAADALLAAVCEKQQVLILAQDAAPAARHEVGEIFVPAGFTPVLPSMRTLTLFDQDWVSTGLQGHCNGFMQIVLSCADASASNATDKAVSYLVDEDDSSPLQMRVTDIWKSVLNKHVIRSGDDFFRLGGHSLLATRVISQLRKVMGIAIPIRTLFEHPRLIDFVRAIETLQGTMGDAKLPPLVPVSRDGKLPLSFTQQQLWLLDQLDPGNPAYNMPFALRIEGDLDVTAFNQAFTTIIERHEVLRTNFREDGGLPYVVVQPASPWKFAALDLSHEPLSQNISRLPALAHEACEARFDITRDLLIRAQLVTLGRDDAGGAYFAVLGAIHHLVSDGWSLNLITHELATLYKAYREKSAALLPPLPIQYIDFAHWQRQWLQGEELERQVAYWKQKLDNEYQVLDLPTDFPRPPIATTRGESFTVTLSGELKRVIHDVAGEANVTPFMVLLSSLYVALHRYSGQAGINIGTPIAGRTLTETEALVGFFINTVIMSVELGDNPTLGALLDRVRSTSLDAYAHQALPFEKIVEVLKPKRDPSRSPLFQVFFNLLNLPDPTEVSGIKVDNLTQDDNDSHAKYDINVYAKEFSDRIDLLVVFNPDLYRKDSVSRIIDAMVATVFSFGRSLQTPVLEIPLQESRIATVDPCVALPAHSGFDPFVRLETFASQMPIKMAIKDTEVTYSYGQLWSSVQSLALMLAKSGVREGDVVAVYAPRCAQLPLAMLSILRAGAAFTVLDPAYPADRLERLCQLAKPALVLTASGLTVPEVLAAAFRACSKGTLIIPATPVAGVATGDETSESPLPAFDPERQAYVAFTSGTTGEPKGIKGCFNPVAHFVDWHVQNAGIGQDDTVSMLSGLAHDPLLRDIFTPLNIGASLVIPAAMDLLEPGRLSGWLREHGVTVTHMTPNLWQLLTQAGDPPALPALRVVAFGGDRLSSVVAGSVLESSVQVRLFNFYGATETPQAMGCIEVTRQHLGSLAIPLGHGIDGVQLLVVNTAGVLCTTGEIGEIWIRTPYLSQGYLGEDSESRFITNPFTQNSADRVYRTGDKGRYLDNGDVEFLGRMDQQVKIRGYRVEPAEIQARLLRHVDVAAAVVVSGGEGNDAVLAAYVVPASSAKGEVNVQALKAHLRQDLPEYMVPAVIMAIDAIPLTPNGKLHRSRLPDIRQAVEGRELVAPRSVTEQEILTLWQTVLKSEHISVTDQFFDVGGHSLLATQVVARVKEKYAIEFSLKNIFEISTVEGMARYVDTALWARNANNAPAESQGNDEDMEEIEI